jgi:hypothetical protein
MLRTGLLICTTALASVVVAIGGTISAAMAALPAPVFTNTCVAEWTPLTSGQLSAYNLTMSNNNTPWGTCVIEAHVYDCAVTLGCPAVVPAPGPLVSSPTCYPAPGADIGNGGPPNYMPNNILTQMGCQSNIMNQYCNFASGCTSPAPQVGQD